MELLLLKWVAALRPIFFINTGISALGLSLFEAAAILFSTFLAISFFGRVATYKNLHLTTIDALVAAYIAWCFAIYLIYIDKSDFRDLLKWVIPFVTYLVAKHVMPNREQYLRIIWLMVVCFAPPILLSTVLILTGHGLDEVNYWTGEARYLGAYDNVHDAGHNMGFFLMLAAVYLLLKRESKNGETASTGAMFKIFLLVFGAMAIFCLYESRVRTVMLGLLVFSAIVVGFYYKRVKLMLIGAALVLVAPFVLEPLKRDLIPEAAQAERDPTFDPTTGYGSGRPMIWKAYIEEFLSKPVDRQIAGVGIGNSARKSWGDWPFWLDAHNEFLNVMVFSGYVGLGLFMALQVAFVKRIVSLEGREKYVFLAFFVAVMVMNFVSNSYVTRFGLAQMFYVVLAYIEVRGRELKANEVNAVAQAYR